MNYSTRALIATILLFMGATACTNQSTDEPKSTQLVGVYRIISGERNGTPISPEELDQATVTISRDTIAAYDKERKETFAAAYTIETERSPWQITMTSTKAPETGVVSKGLVQADQEQVKLIYALPNGQAPTEFKTGEQQQMFVLGKTGQGTKAGSG
jgi:uncharacterized protein (TIGR03067 family)